VQKAVWRKERTYGLGQIFTVIPEGIQGARQTWVIENYCPVVWLLEAFAFEFKLVLGETNAKSITGLDVSTMDSSLEASHQGNMVGTWNRP
jgi:hypothetical protein